MAIAKMLAKVFIADAKQTCTPSCRQQNAYRTFACPCWPVPSCTQL
jgi:hypothetical protein